MLNDLCSFDIFVSQEYISKFVFLLNLIQFQHQKMLIHIIVLLKMILDDTVAQIPLCKQHPVMTTEIISNYEKVLSYSNLKLHTEISHRNVAIHENQHIHQIYTKSNGTNLPDLVFLHGFGGTSMTAIRMFQHFYGRLQVHALDVYGFGYSSRGKFSDDFTFEETRDYYVEAVEQWRKALRIQKFFLVGHSFGGYLAAWYTAKYPQRVTHLFLVSPAGTSDHTRFNANGQITCKQKMFLGLAQKIYNWNIRPTKAMTNWLIGNKMVNSVLINRLKIPENEQEDWKLYLRNVNSQEESSEVGFYRLFQWPLKPKITIQEMIKQKMIPLSIDFYFGDEDWMPKQGAQRLSTSDQYKNIKTTIVPKAGHQIVFDNSQFLCGCILERVTLYKQK